MTIKSPIESDRKIIGLCNKYNISIMSYMLIIRANQLVISEMEDFNYIEEKIQNHLEY